MQTRVNDRQLDQLLDISKFGSQSWIDGWIDGYIVTEVEHGE